MGKGPSNNLKNDFVSKGRSVSDLKAHLVLTTKYRRKALTDEMLTRLHEILVELLSKCDCKLIEFNGEEDHVHLLFQYHPYLQLSTLVNNVKSIKYRTLRQEFSEHLSKIYWKDVFWNGPLWYRLELSHWSEHGSDSPAIHLTLPFG